MHKKSILLTIVLLLNGLFLLAQQEPYFDSLKIIASGAVLKEVSGQFLFTEGPVADKYGAVYFTDQPNNQIWKYNVEGTLALFMDNAGRSNGLAIDKHGNIIACADENDELWSISPGTKIKVLLKNIAGKKMNGPNDLWLDKKGGIYFTDPYYQRDYWTRKQPEIKQQNVYYLPKNKTQPVAVDDQLVKPNGIVGSADGRTLFVADIGDNKTYKYTIKSGGLLADRQLFVHKGSDGLTLDDQGNLYITGKGVTVYNKTGHQIAYIPVPVNWVANICFGGKDRNILFMTAGKSVFVLNMNVKGM